MDESMRFTVVNDEGEEVECELLFSFESEETGRSYLVYTDGSVDATGNTKVFASAYDPDAEEPALMPLETEEEWQMIGRILEELQGGMGGMTHIGGV